MADLARLDIFRHRLTAVAEEMGAALQRAAYSANIKERLDFSCAVFDGGGRLLAQAAHIPVHLGAMPAAVAAARAQCPDWRPGDVVVLNDPFAGGSHLPDITTVSPVIVGGLGHPVAFVATRAHHADVGGATPGSMPLVRDLVAEGLVIPPVHLARAGMTDEALLALIVANSRTPAERRGDLDAQLGAQRRGTARLTDLAADPAAFAAEAGSLLAYTAGLARRRLAVVPPGTYIFQDVMDGDGFGATDVVIHVSVTADGRGGLKVDFAGTAPQTAGGINAPLAVTQSAVYYVAACLMGDVPLNAGAFESVTVTAPAGCLLNPEPPAAVAAGNVETSQRVVDVLLGALHGALPDRIPAASQGTMNNLILGGVDPTTGRCFTYYETLAGGAGGGPAAPGAAAIQVHMTNTRTTPVEALEVACPVRVTACGLRRGSGGAGRHPGGDGLERRLLLLAPTRVTLISERRAHQPWGLDGGGAGQAGEAWRVKAAQWSPLAGKDHFTAEAGDEVVVRTPGGGGWGRPPD